MVDQQIHHDSSIISHHSRMVSLWILFVTFYLTVTPLKYVEGGPGLILPEVVYNSYSVRMFGGDGRLRIFKCAVPSSFTTIINNKKQQDCRALCGGLGSSRASEGLHGRPRLPHMASQGLHIKPHKIGQGLHIGPDKASTQPVST